MNEPRDELLERYADAVAQDPRRPADRVRNAARAHAQMLRDQAAALHRVESDAPPKPVANQPQWTLSLVASLAVVGLAGLLYLQMDRGTPEVRETALGTATRRDAPAPPAPSAAPSARTDTAQASPPEQPAPALEAHKRPSEKTLPATPAKAPAVATRQEMSPSPPTVPLEDSAQTMANAATARAYSAPTAEADAAPRSVSKAADQVASAGAVGDAKSGASVDPHGRGATPAMPAAAAPPGTPRRAREMDAGTATALFLEAVRAGRVETMQKLLAQGVAINARDDRGNTALMVAVRQRQAPAVRKLLDMGADTTLVNEEGLTALGLASSLGLADMVKLLQAPR